MAKKPSKRTLLQFLYYNLGGACFFVIGYLLFSLLYGLLGIWWLLAKGVADLVGWTVNFIIQRYLAFKEEAVHHNNRAIIKKFSAFSLLNLLIDYAIVGGLKWIGLTPFIGLFVSAAFFTIWKYAWYKHWIFKHP
jgi:putative flippase GtrA